MPVLLVHIVALTKVVAVDRIYQQIVAENFTDLELKY